MSEIIQLKGKKEPSPPKIWVCLCGCSTFELLSTAEVRCPVCLLTSPAPDGGWTPDPEAADWQGKDENDAPIRDISGNGSIEFARHMLLNHAKDPEACAIIVFKLSGSVHAWSMAETQEQLEWLRQKLDIAYEISAKKLEDE